MVCKTEDNSKYYYNIPQGTLSVTQVMSTVMQ